MTVEKESIVIFESACDLDHVFSLLKHYNFLDNSIIENLKNNFLFELSLSINLEKGIDYFSLPIKIPKNERIKDFPTEYENFAHLLKEFFINKNNSNIIPYYEDCSFL